MGQQSLPNTINDTLPETLPGERLSDGSSFRGALPPIRAGNLLSDREINASERTREAAAAVGFPRFRRRELPRRRERNLERSVNLSMVINKAQGSG